jgi:hypothetical protein
MVTTRKPPEAPETDDDGFSETQKSQLSEMIAAAVKGDKAPPSDPGGPKKLTDDEWDAMTDRGRESWVRKLVDFRLDELFKEDEQRRLAAEVEALKAGLTSKPEPEKTPGMLTRLQKTIWGRPDDPA